MSVVPPSSQLAKYEENPGCKVLYNTVLPLSHLKSREGSGGGLGVGGGKWIWSAYLWPLAHSGTGLQPGPSSERQVALPKVEVFPINTHHCPPPYLAPFLPNPSLL